MPRPTSSRRSSRRSSRLPARTSDAPRGFRRTGLHANYPATVAQVLDDSQTYPAAVLRAMRDFKRSRPYRGTRSERQAKMQALIATLSGIYRIARPRLVFAAGAAMGPCYYPARHMIFMGASLSVVTLLHEFAHSRGADEVQACRWSINLFRRVFPRLFARCEQRGHMLIAPTRSGDSRPL